MPIGAAIGAAVIGGGAAIVGAGKQADAVKDSTAATTAANNAALQLQREQYDQQRADYAPWRAVGAGALQMLARTMGIYVPADTFRSDVAPAPTWTAPTTETSGGTTMTDEQKAAAAANGEAPLPGATPAGAAPLITPGQTSEQAYLASRPDVAAEYQQESTRDNKSKAYLQKLGINSAEDYAKWHSQTFGIAMPAATEAVYGPAPAATTPAAGTTTGGATTPAPATGAAPTPTGGTTYTGQAVDLNGIPKGATDGTNARYGDFYASPDYAFRRDEGLRAVTGNYAARGMLDSGAAGKGLIGYGQAAASQEFGSWFNRIASLAGVGQTAVANSTAAGQAAANGQQGIIQSQGQSTASSIATQGGITAGLVNNLGNTAAGLITNLGSGSSGLTAAGTPATVGMVNGASAPGNVAGLVPTNVGSGLFGSTV